jgi:hypothetical protein
LAFRVVGTGSVGLRSYVALLHGNENEDLVLQLSLSFNLGACCSDPG